MALTGALTGALTAQERHDFEVYVATRSGSLMRTAYLLTGQRADAEDLLQTTLAKAYLSWSRVRDRQAVDAYVRRTMVTTHISLWRRRKVDEIPTAELPDAGTDDFTGNVDLHDSLWQLLDDLPKRQRAVVVMRYYEDLSEAETAEALGCSQGTVKSQASKALAKLRSALVESDSAFQSDHRAALPTQLPAHPATGASR